MRNDSVNLFWRDAQINDTVSENITRSQNCIIPEASCKNIKERQHPPLTKY